MTENNKTQHASHPAITLIEGERYDKGFIVVDVADFNEIRRKSREEGSDHICKIFKFSGQLWLLKIYTQFDYIGISLKLSVVDNARPFEYAYQFRSRSGEVSIGGDSRFQEEYIFQLCDKSIVSNNLDLEIYFYHQPKYIN